TKVKAETKMFFKAVKEGSKEMCRAYRDFFRATLIVYDNIRQEAQGIPPSPAAPVTIAPAANATPAAAAPATAVPVTVAPIAASTTAAPAIAAPITIAPAAIAAPDVLTITNAATTAAVTAANAAVTAANAAIAAANAATAAANAVAAANNAAAANTVAAARNRTASMAYSRRASSCNSTVVSRSNSLICTCNSLHMPSPAENDTIQTAGVQPRLLKVSADIFKPANNLPVPRRPRQMSMTKATETRAYVEKVLDSIKDTPNVEVGTTKHA
ncbi:hypothetical protein H4R20_006554, partial [Coemansia guatemalensis]